MIHSRYYAVIMAGGVGSRFWPSSRTSRPKQFIDILGVGQTLLQMTFARLSKLIPCDHIYVVTGEAYASLAQEQLPQLSAEQILTEPFRRNTAPCIAYAARVIRERDSNAVLFVAPSDHLILNEPAFLNTLELAMDSAAREEVLITLGIQPSRPDTNYGYIELEHPARLLDRQKVLSFKEKPDRLTAETFLEQQKFLWNSGMFCWSVSAFQAALRDYAPLVYAAFEKHSDVREAFEASPSISVDYAIMEKSDQVFVFPAEFGWSDLGTWDSLHALAPKDADGNAVEAQEAYLTQTTNCTIKSHRTVVCDSVDQLLIVDTPDILLVCKRDDARFKEIAETLSKKF